MKKKLSILAVLVLAVTVTAYSVSGTYAKYTSTFTGSTSTARVAKWAFTVNSANITKTNTFTFDLFKTVKDSDGAAETDVKVGEDENIIAPGTSGSFKIALANASEVNAKYSIAYTVTNDANIPVEFSVNGTDWTKDLTTLNVTDAAINMTSGEAEVNVQWRWTYEATDRDAADTKLGVNAVEADQTITVKADVTATQVD